MTNKSIDPVFISALDVLTGALGVFIILNFLNTRMMSAQELPPPPVVASKENKKPRPEAPLPRETRRPEPRWSSSPRPSPAPTPPAATPAPAPAPAAPTPKPEPAKPSPVENLPPSPPQDPVAVDLLKQTKGAVTLLLQQDGVAKQTVEFMLRQGKKTWKPGRASKYQNSEFRYEKGLTYFYQEEIEPGTYEVMVRVKRGNKNAGGQTFSMFGKIIPPGQKSQTHHFGTYAVNGDDWISAGSFTISASTLTYKSTLPPASANKPIAEPVNTPAESPKTKPKKTGKWG